MGRSVRYFDAADPRSRGWVFDLLVQLSSDVQLYYERELLNVFHIHGAAQNRSNLEVIALTRRKQDSFVSSADNEAREEKVVAALRIRYFSNELG